MRSLLKSVWCCLIQTSSLESFHSIIYIHFAQKSVTSVWKEGNSSLHAYVYVCVSIGERSEPTAGRQMGIAAHARMWCVCVCVRSTWKAGKKGKKSARKILRKLKRKWSSWKTRHVDHLLAKFEHIFVAAITFPPPFFCADTFDTSLLLIVCASR